MEQKDPKDMTASELLREADSNPCSMCHLVMTGDESCATTGCASWAYRLADKIDAEIVKAYSEKLNTCAMRWAKANGWPDFREGEDFGAWLERCTYKKPVDDCNEPVQFGDDIELHYSGGGVDKGLFQEVAINKGPVSILSFVGVSHARDYRYDSECDVLKRPAPEVLGADGKPIKEGDAVWLAAEYSMLADSSGCEGGNMYSLQGIERHETMTVENSHFEVAGKDYARLVSCSAWCPASWLTHTPPDTQERIDADAAKVACNYFRNDGNYCEGCPVYDHKGLRCNEAMILDLLRRQRELDARMGGAE
jgi:hypothetical protein|nr:MAG TPA: hypothetical protein [Caudoviricetes sp.]